VIPAVILAAGLSSRMGGRTKALLPLPGGDTFLTRIVRTLLDAGVDDIVAVTGHEHERVAASLAAAKIRPRIVVNPRYREGHFSSVLAALDAVDRPGVEAIMLTLVDVPLAGVTTVERVLQRYRERRPPVVRPVRGDQHGHPVILDRALFAGLRAADPAEGIKPVVRANVSAAGDVEIEDEGALSDIDTPDAYRRIVGIPLEW
jgi:molybdenum cofactor cytidylyltransferase